MAEQTHRGATPAKVTLWYWRDFAVTFILFLALTPIFFWGYWINFGFAILVFSLFVIAYGLPVVGIYLLLYRHFPSWIDRLAVQMLVLLMLLIPANVAGLIGEKISVDTTFKNAQVIISALEQYRTRHGAYPPSLAVAEADLGQVFPQPTINRSGFHYQGQKDAFQLEFQGAFMDYWFYDCQSKEWRKD